MTAVAIAADRSLLVGPGQAIRTAWIDVWQVKLACRDRMAAGDVSGAFQRLLQLGDAAAWPPPNGHWEVAEGDGRFVIEDGRHEFIASLMHGRERVFVAWLVDQPSQVEFSSGGSNRE